MKTRVSLYLILAALACAPHAAGQEAAGQAQPASAQAAAWSRYTYEGEEFSVELPGMPWVHHTRRTVREIPYEGEKWRLFGFYADRVAYMIVSFDKPRSSESDDRLTSYVGRGLTAKGDVKLGGVSGREYEFRLYSFKGAARLFRMKNRAYILKAFSDAEGRRDAVERFLNSFALGAKPSGEMIADDPPTPPFEPPKELPPPGPAGGGTGPGRAGGTEGPAAPGAGGGPFRSADVVRKATIVYKPEPDYTEEARKKGVTGVVRLRAILSSSGKVTNISVIRWLPRGLTDSAVRAARHILFFPAVKDGREVSQYVVLEYNFNIY